MNYINALRIEKWAFSGLASLLHEVMPSKIAELDQLGICTLFDDGG
jgi:hypothetical protein